MDDDWTDGPTRIHQYAPPGRGAARAAASAHESSTVVVDRESLLARVSASMAVPEDVRRTIAGPTGAPLTFPFGHDTEDAAADRTPPPVQIRRQTHPPASGQALRHVPPRRPSIKLGTHLSITLGIAASFMLGLSLRSDPAPDVASPPVVTPTVAARAPALRTATPPPAAVTTRVVPARGRLTINSSPPGAYVALDGEVGPGPTPREVDVELGRWVTVHAQRPGFQPSSRTVFVQQPITELDIPLEAEESAPSGRKR